MNGAKHFCGMIDLTAHQIKFAVNVEKLGVPVIGEKTAIVENHVAATTVNKRKFPIMKEVAVIKMDAVGVSEEHDAVGTVVDD